MASEFSEFAELPSHEAEPGREFNGWLERITGANKRAVDKFIADGDHLERLNTAPGSREAHHAWEGGYKEHVIQTFALATEIMASFEKNAWLDHLPEEERFSLSDALTVLFLHDIEKPFIYEISADGEINTVKRMTKADRKVFRAWVVDTYGFELSPTMENALLYVEGVRDEYYVPGERADQPLAALCHAADNLSARALYNFGRPD
jgi:hypothetical protein